MFVDGIFWTNFTLECVPKMKIEDSIALGLYGGLFVIFFLIMIYWSVRTSSKKKRKAKRASFEAVAMNKMNTDKFFQADSTYYSYTTRKPFYMRLFSRKGVWSPLLRDMPQVGSDIFAHARYTCHAECFI